MALNAYLKLTGQKSGPITGSSTQKGREGKIIVCAADHELIAPRDVASGQATGRRQHSPFVITKEIDLATPKLYQLLVTNENITDWELQFWAPNTKAAGGTGTEIQRYTVTLKNAAISDIRFTMPDNRDPVLGKWAEYEEVSFVYQKITWTWVQGGITASDDWQIHPGA